MTNAQEISENELRLRAYDLWERAGKPENESEHFWYSARKLFLESTPDPTIQEMAQGYSDHAIRSYRIEEGYFSGEIARIFEDFPELKQSDPQQDLLWHYTSGYSIIKIINSGELWTTHLSCLNDGREFIHAFKLMKDVLDLKSQDGYTGEIREFHEFLDSQFEKMPSPYSDLYVASLSEKEDDLSQWRAYGGKRGEDGYCIGFDATFVKPKYNAPVYGVNPFLGKVSYDESRHRQICRRILDVVFRFFKVGVEWNENLDLHKKIVYRWLERYAFLWFPLMKEKSFADEAEWRIVYRTTRSDEQNIKFLARESMISRHIPQTYLRPDKNKMLLPIRVILVGPSRYKEISRESVKLQLASKGYCRENLGWTPSVEDSNIPLQG